VLHTGPLLAWAHVSELESAAHVVNRNENQS
jgi:hypothetical protein